MDSRFTLDSLPDVLTIAELARYLRLAEGTCYSMVREGQIRGIRVGRRILIPKIRLVEWLETAGAAA